MQELIQKGIKAKSAAMTLATLSTDRKVNLLLSIADNLLKNTEYILEENKKDIESAQEKGINTGLIDRLTLTPQRLEGIAQGIRQVAELSDPIGEVIDSWRRPNGLEISQVRVPLGVCGIIYEARPNVTADAAALCLMSGNACILRCGKEAH